MGKLIFATNNEHKLFEIKHLLEGSGFEVKGLKESDIHEDIPEDHNTLEGNALQKAKHIFKLTGENCFADDTGLEIHALNGEPGVYSARYSRIGSPRYPHLDVTKGNIRKVLEKMEGMQDRNSRFRTVIALILDAKIFTFEGIVEGKIIESPKGLEGFGYDPVFVPDGYTQTFAEMPVGEKNRISHRARAMKKLIEFLKTV